jgi:hypothetical protein
MIAVMNEGCRLTVLASTVGSQYICHQSNRISSIRVDNRQSAIDNRQSPIFNRQ